MTINLTAAADTRETSLVTGVATYATHRMVHPRGLPGCPACPSAPCRCERPNCPDLAEHTRAYAAAETTWREVAAR